MSDEEKEELYVRTSISLPIDLLNLLNNLKNKDRRSLSAQIAYMVENYIELTSQSPQKAEQPVSDNATTPVTNPTDKKRSGTGL